MDKQRDEFQELIRNFSLNDSQLRRTAQPSVQTQQQFQPRERPQQPARQSSSDIGDELLRGFSPAASGSGQPPRQQEPYRQNVRQQSRPQSAPGQGFRQGGYPPSAGRSGMQQAAPPPGQAAYAQSPYQQNARQQSRPQSAPEPSFAPPQQAPSPAGQDSLPQGGYRQNMRQQGFAGEPASGRPQAFPPREGMPQQGAEARRAAPRQTGPQSAPSPDTSSREAEPARQSSAFQSEAQLRGAARQNSAADQRSAAQQSSPAAESAPRFSPAGFQPQAAGRQDAQEPAAQAFSQPAAQQAAPRAARFNPAGLQAQAAGRQGGQDFAPAPPRKNFTLNIASPEYNEFPDEAGAGNLPPEPPAYVPEREDPPKRRRRRGRISRFFEALVLVMGAVACAVFLAIFALQSAGDMLGMNKPDIEAEVSISESDSLTEVAETLQQAGIIEQPLTFELYAKLLKKDEWQTGTYKLNTKMAYSQILNRFKRGNVEQETVRIMFPEGQTIIQIAEKLEENHVCSAEDFLEAADTGSFDFQFEDQIPRSPLRFHRLEGYIFPDTYDFYVGQNPESVVRRFLEIFNTRVTQDLYDLMEKRGLTLDETIALASIIQKETGNVENMYYVSSVFHNRLASPESYPRLQSDATTDYVENTIKPNLSTENQEMFDAYDTYTCEGLPAGPINNPGLNAIKAALDPLETDYYFFLSDQKGEYHFARNINEHNAFLADAGEAHGTAIDHTGS